MIRFFAVIFISVLGLCVTGAAQEKAALQKAPDHFPISYGLVVDNSGSFRSLLDKVITVVSDVVEENESEDEVFLVTFVDTPKIFLRQEFTYRKSDLHDAAQNMFIEGGQTAILDAVKSSTDYLAENARTDAGRARAIVLVTDGEDRGSESKIDDVIRLLKEKNIRVFVIAMAEGKVFTKVLDRLTKETGGLVVTPKRMSDLGAAAKQVASAMRTK